MGCCGEPLEKPIPEEGNRITPFTTGGPVSQQPSAQSMQQWQEKTLLNSVTAPPPVLQYGQQQWDAAGQHGSPDASALRGSTLATAFASSSPSPPPNAYSPPHSPPLAHPTAVYAPTAPRPIAMTVTGRRETSPTAQGAFAPPADEGKLSVAIDFGECCGACDQPSVLSTPLQARRSRAW